VQLVRGGGEAALAGDGIQYQQTVQRELHGLLIDSKKGLECELHPTFGTRRPEIAVREPGEGIPTEVFPCRRQLFLM